MGFDGQERELEEVEREQAEYAEMTEYSQAESMGGEWGAAGGTYAEETETVDESWRSGDQSYELEESITERYATGGAE